jgi:hypothetical protein
MRSTHEPRTRLECLVGTSPLLRQRGHTSWFLQPYAATRTRSRRLGSRRFSGCSRSQLSTLPEIETGSIGYRALDPVHGEPPPTDDTMGDLAKHQLTVLRAPQLTFQRIKLDSPLEIIVAAAGSTGVIIYALHLLCAFLVDPERIGGWLPRLVTGWHKARRDAEMVRQGQRVEVIRGRLTDLLVKQNMSSLMRLAQNPELQDLHPAQITLVGGDDETPEDIRKALEARPD